MYKYDDDENEPKSDLDTISEVLSNSGIGFEAEEADDDFEGGAIILDNGITFGFDVDYNLISVLASRK